MQNKQIFINILLLVWKDDDDTRFAKNQAGASLQLRPLSDKSAFAFIIGFGGRQAPCFWHHSIVYEAHHID